MTVEKMTCKVTDTKQDILKAYKTHLETLNSRAQGSLNVEQVTAEKMKVDTLKRVEQIVKLDVPTTILQLQNQVTQTLQGILSTLDDKRNALASVETAIKIKQTELNELYGIEKEAASLAALIDSYRHKNEELTAEQNERMNELIVTMDEAKKNFEKTKTNWLQELTEMKRVDTLTRHREEEAFKYSFERSKQLQLDLLADQIAKQNATAKAREDAVTIREKTIADLDKTIADLNVRLTTDVAKAITSTEESAKRSAATVAQFANMSHKAEVERLNSQLESANARATDLVSQVGRLQIALDKANEKVQSIAEAALKSGADAKTLAELRSYEPSGRNSK